MDIKMISFRELKISDFAFMREMLYEALFVPEGEKPFDRSIIDLPEISKYTDNWGTPDDFGLIVCNDEIPVGAIWGRLYHEGHKGYGFIDEQTPEMTIAIRSEYRNKGLGTSMMVEFTKCAKKNGYEGLSLSVDKRNRAVNLYQRIGFVVFDELETAYTMKLQITNLTDL